jgi:hypothetical protein
MRFTQGVVTLKVINPLTYWLFMLTSWFGQSFHPPKCSIVPGGKGGQTEDKCSGLSQIPNLNVQGGARGQ